MLDSIWPVLFYLQCLLGVVSTASCLSPLGRCSTLTTSGKLIGDCKDSKVHKYLSVPYAEPPIGNLRLADPRPFQKDLSVTISTAELPPSCPQLGDPNISEDCLYLNIYAPTTNGFKPVLFWIYGGSNFQGSSRDPIFDGTTFAKNENVVIVTYNYRLGVLGFFDDGGNTNYAVKDTLLALKWVKNNVGRFGGDNTKITVFGNSSGGALIRAMLASPSARGLVNNAIFQSDPQNFGFTNRTTSRDYISGYIMSLLGCSDFQCVKNKSLSDILTAQYKLLGSTSSLPSYLNKAYLFGPVIDNQILFEDYGNSLKDGSLTNKVDTIIGFVNTEAGPSINAISQTPLPQAYYGTVMSAFVDPRIIPEIISSDPAFTSILNSSHTDSTREQLTFTGSSIFWTCPSQYNAVNSAGHRKTYVYKLTKGIQHPTNSGNSLCSNGAVCHQDDLYLTFGTYTKASPELAALSKEIQKRWANFARTGNPNYNGILGWDPVASASNLNVLNLGDNKILAGVDTNACTNLHQATEYNFEIYSH